MIIALLYTESGVGLWANVVFGEVRFYIPAWVYLRNMDGYGGV